MRLYLTSRRWHVLFIATLVVSLLPLAGAGQVGFPAVIGSGDGSVLPVSSIAPLSLGVTVSWALTARSTHLTSNAARRTGSLDALVLIGLIFVVFVLTSTQQEHDWMLLRNAAILTSGAALLTALCSTPLASTTVTMVTVIVLTYGTAAPGARFVRVLQADPGAPWPLALSVGVTILACAALTVVPPRAKSVSEMPHA